MGATQGAPATGAERESTAWSYPNGWRPDAYRWAVAIDGPNPFALSGPHAATKRAALVSLAALLLVNTAFSVGALAW
jgi:hypothetical protein